MNIRRLGEQSRSSASPGAGRGSLRVVMLATVVVAGAASVQARGSEHADRVDDGGLVTVDAHSSLDIIDRDRIEHSGATSLYDLLVERAAYNGFGLRRALVLGSSRAVFLVNGRRISSPGASFVLELLPVAAVERVEITRPGTSLRHEGEAVAGTVNIVLRRDYEGVDFRAATERPGGAGGETAQGGAVWGGAVGRGHLVMGVDVFNRREIRSADREYSRAFWTPGGAFSDTAGVSIGGNTLFIGTADGTIARPLGACSGAGYTGVLAEPGGYSGAGCGFAYADIAWETLSLERESVFASFDLPVNDGVDLYADARLARGEANERYAPSVGTFSFSPSPALSQVLLADPDIDEVPETIQVAHRFVGHGNRDWRIDLTDHDVTIGLRGRLGNDMEWDTRLRAHGEDAAERGDTFVSEGAIQRAIDDGRYDVENPLSTAPWHREAIRETGLALARDNWTRHTTTSVGLAGRAMELRGGSLTWTAGAEVDFMEDRDISVYRDTSGGYHEAIDVLGSGGTSYSGDRRRLSGLVQASLPLGAGWEVGLGARRDDYDDVGETISHRISSEYRLTEAVTIRGAWAADERPPELSDLHASSSIYYPYICDTKSFTGDPGECDRTQVEAESGGNRALSPDDSRALGMGVEARVGAVALSADWFRIEISNAPAQMSEQTLVNLDARGEPLPAGARIVRDGGLITRIVNPLVNSGEISATGVDVRAQIEWTTAWADTLLDVRWLHESDYESRVGGEVQPGDRPRNRVQAGFQATRGVVTASWDLHAISGYWNSRETGRFGSWFSHDVMVRWRDSFGLRGMTLAAGVLNLTDRGPSVDPTDPTSVAGGLDSFRGRTLFLSARMAW